MTYTLYRAIIDHLGGTEPAEPVFDWNGVQVVKPYHGSTRRYAVEPTRVHKPTRWRGEPVVRTVDDYRVFLDILWELKRACFEYIDHLGRPVLAADASRWVVIVPMRLSRLAEEALRAEMRPAVTIAGGAAYTQNIIRRDHYELEIAPQSWPDVIRMIGMDDNEGEAAATWWIEGDATRD